MGRLTRELSHCGVSVTPKAVYGWVEGRRLPGIPTIRAIEALSRGSIRLRDICQHRDLVIGGESSNEAA